MSPALLDQPTMDYSHLMVTANGINGMNGMNGMNGVHKLGNQHLTISQKKVLQFKMINHNWKHKTID